MIPLESLRYHPNSYIASRRSSLPRQGYGGVYERRLKKGFALTSSPSSSQLRETRTLPRNFSDFAIHQTTSESVLSTASGKSTISDSSDIITNLSQKSKRGDEDLDLEENTKCIVKDRPPSPPLSLPSVRLKWRKREEEERRMMKKLKEARERQGKVIQIPSALLCDLVMELVGLELETEEEEKSERSDENITGVDTKSQEDWNVLITNLVNRKKHIRAILDREYRDSKRQASQMRQPFERVSSQAVSRFDRLISDILCYARLVCHLARQSTRLGKEELPSECNILIEEKRNILNQQLLELPRLRHSLLLRQASLIRLCTDSLLVEELREKLSLYWSYAVQLCTIDSEIVLDNELS